MSAQRQVERSPERVGVAWRNRDMEVMRDSISGQEEIAVTPI